MSYFLTLWEYFATVCAVYLVLWGFAFVTSFSRYWTGNGEGTSYSGDCEGNRRTQFLIEQCSHDPKKNTNFGSGPHVAGIFVKYTFIYPFIRHRVTTEDKVFRRLMWLHWVWWVCNIVVYISSFILLE